MPFGGLLTAGISAGTKLIGGAIASKGAKKASQQQQEAVRRAHEFANQRYLESAQMLAPYRNAGEGALRTLSGLLSAYRQPSLPPSATPWMARQQRPPVMTMADLMGQGIGSGFVGRALGPFGGTASAGVASQPRITPAAARAMKQPMMTDMVMP